MCKYIKYIGIIICLFSQTTAYATGIAIDKIYLPYVEPLEREIEYRALRFEGGDPKNDNIQKHKLAYGQALSEKWFGEVYIMGSNPNDGDFDIDGYELEAKWQATEQGEYAFDVGFLFELEREEHDDVWELAGALLLTKELGKFVSTANIFLIIEDSKTFGRESESAANLQVRYRLSPSFEPAIEIYRAEDTFGIGPVIMGTERISIGQKIHWELGVIAGVLHDMPDTTIKGLIEYEF
jgi:hypothetical protein